MNVEVFLFFFVLVCFLTDHQKSSGKPECLEHVLRASCTLEPSDTLLVIWQSPLIRSVRGRSRVTERYSSANYPLSTTFPPSKFI